MEKIKNFYSDENSSEKRKTNKISRRDFIRLGATSFLGILGGRQLIKILEEKNIWENLKERNNELGTIYQERGELDISPEQERIRRDGIKIIGETIEKQLLSQKEIVLNSETKNALWQKWKESYSPKPKNYSGENLEFGKNYLGLEQAMQKMQPWMPEIFNEFRRAGVPEKFAYLAIPESHFNLSSTSRAQAKGPYQFTKNTAKLYNLRVDDLIDNRCDPIKSARACAEHLKESYGRFNNDWDLAFADYNGGFTNKYAKLRDKKDRNYEDYLKWREKRINDYIKKNKEGAYSVKKGDTLFKIAKKFEISVEKIKVGNNLTGDVINIGQKLKINKNTFNINDLDDSLENLNYPEKFYAILDVIEEQKLEEKFPPEKLIFDLIEVPKVDFIDIGHIIQKGENLFGISKKLKEELSVENLDLGYSVNSILNLIKSQNKIKKPEAIQPGQKIFLRIPISKSPSLSSMAKNHEIDLKDLQFLNPAIKNPIKPLPGDLKIRIPKK